MFVRTVPDHVHTFGSGSDFALPVPIAFQEYLLQVSPCLGCVVHARAQESAVSYTHLRAHETSAHL
eukprot:8666379-Alexandrium_andersonii.AAC.1